ncbi:MAG: fumarylacetoacetate hydrolase family protein [Pseudomonadota bacterium]
MLTLLVESYDGEQVVGVDLRDLGAPASENPFVALGTVPDEVLTTVVPSQIARTTVKVDDLLPTAPRGSRHIGIGTNFPEHAQEARSSSVFNFPKFGTATQARTSIRAPLDGLLDYEVELCVRFDRPIRSVEDFDNSIKGFFLCADFTERIKLLQLAAPDNLDSGYGFSDAKSGPGFFPSGPFLVIPRDWQSFVANTRMTTALNSEPRQDARGSEMTLDFRALTAKVLGDMTRSRFYYRGDFYTLASNSEIDAEMTLMSGTSEGVIFTPPGRHDYIEILLRYLFSGAFMDTVRGGDSLMDFAIQEFIENERRGNHFLKPGDTVVYAGSGLGDIIVAVTE